MDKKRLKSLTEKNSGWTKDDKEFLSSVLDKLGIERPKKTSCQSCWRDAAIMAFRQVNSAAETETGEAPAMRLRGDAATDGVFWHDVFVHPSVMTAELAEWLISTNFPKQCYYEN